MSNSLVSIAGGLSTLVDSAVNYRNRTCWYGKLSTILSTVISTLAVTFARVVSEAAQRRVGRRGYGAGRGDEAVEAWAEGSQLLDKVANHRQQDDPRLHQRRRQRRSHPIAAQLTHHVADSRRDVSHAAHDVVLRDQGFPRRRRRRRRRSGGVIDAAQRQFQMVSADDVLLQQSL